jgi:hypothetical protein
MANYWKHIGFNEQYGIIDTVQAIRCGKNSDNVEFTRNIIISPNLTLDQSNAIKALSSSDLEDWVEARCDVSVLDQDLVQEGNTPEEAKILEK